jgi:RHS repeat-associated protein
LRYDLAVDRNGRATVYVPDELGRVTFERWYASQADAEAGTGQLHEYAYVYDEGGRLLEAGDGDFDYDYLYDDLDRVTDEQVSGLGTPIYLETLYPTRTDALRETLDVYRDGGLDTTTAFTYDGNLRLATITQTPGSGAVGQSKHAKFDYTDSGRFDRVRLYQTASPTDSTFLVADTLYAYDERSRLTSLRHTKNGNPLAQYAYSYDANSRIERLTSADGTAEYAYDEGGQLTSETYNAGQASSLADQTFEWDANGVRTGGEFVPGFYNRPVTNGDLDQQFTYDDEGNRARFTDTASGYYTDYLWDHRNRLRAVIERDSQGAALSSTIFAYDYLGRLVGRSHDADGAGAGAAVVENFVYDGSQIILRLDSDGDVLNRYLWGPGYDLLLADEAYVDNTGSPDTSNTRWMLGDHQNTIRDIVDFDESDGSVDSIDHRVYTAFGAPVNPWAADTIFGFQGKLFDEAVGTNHLHRWLDNWLAQWLSEDPAGFSAGDPNLRRAMGNDPVDRIDPDGLEIRLLNVSPQGYAYEGSRGTSGDDNLRLIVTANADIVTEHGTIPRGTVLQRIDWDVMKIGRDRWDDVYPLARSIAEETEAAQRIRFDVTIAWSQEAGLVEQLSTPEQHRLKHFAAQYGNEFVESINPLRNVPTITGAMEYVSSAPDDSSVVEGIPILGDVTYQGRVMATGYVALDHLDFDASKKLAEIHVQRVLKGDSKAPLRVWNPARNTEAHSAVANAVVHAYANYPHLLAMQRALQIHYDIGTGPSPIVRYEADLLPAGKFGANSVGAAQAYRRNINIFVQQTTPWQRRVYQRSDINWDLVRPKGVPAGGKTNLQAAMEGWAPGRYNPLTGKWDDAVLHHSLDDPRGAIIETWRSSHTRFHNRYGTARNLVGEFEGDPRPWRDIRPDWATAWEKEQHGYWRWRTGVYNPQPTTRLMLPGDE